MSKIGVHVFIGPRNSFGPFLKKIADAGQTLAVVKCVDDFGSAAEAKQYNPKTLTVGRLDKLHNAKGESVDAQAWGPPKPGGPYKNAQEAAEQYYGMAQPIWQKNPQIDVWETFNEFSAHWGWQGEFYVAMMDLVE